MAGLDQVVGVSGGAIAPAVSRSEDRDIMKKLYLVDRTRTNGTRRVSVYSYRTRYGFYSITILLAGETTLAGHVDPSADFTHRTADAAAEGIPSTIGPTRYEQDERRRGAIPGRPGPSAD